MVDIDRSGNIENYKKDLKADIEALQLLQSNLIQFERKIAKEIKKPRNHNSEDDKLETLINRIVKKRQSGENGGNAKVLIFTVYKDTAFYLFEQLTARGFDKVAAVSGDFPQFGTKKVKLKIRTYIGTLCSFHQIVQRKGMAI
ncbi:MAG: hypothetical protein IPN13_06360 [Bacteroidetes bacterium]|nr:hypothetical protein [Bacteroidota bacterium]